MMKAVITSTFLFSTLMVCGQSIAPQLIPQPVVIKITGGTFKITGATSISFNDPRVQPAADMLVQRINTPTGYKLRAQKGNNGTIQLNINAKPNTILGVEGYTLEVDKERIVVAANQPAGVFYGIQTLLQLLPKEIESRTPVRASWALPTVHITDYPRFAWRGIMLDVSRNFFTKEEVKQYIDQIARYKYNVFHWHLTDDNGWRIEIKSLPKLTEVGAWRVPRYGRFGERHDPKPGEKATDGGFYTHDDIKEIVRYALDRNITIVPEIDIPGHSMAAIASYPELSCTKDTSIKVNPGTPFATWYGNGTFKMHVENTLNPSDEKVYEFLDKVFTEVAQLFPGEYIHAGGDECYYGYWKQDEGCKALMRKLNIRHAEDLQGYFMNRVEAIIKSKGKKMIGWDEILEGGISPEAAVMSWRGVQGGIEAAQHGNYVVMAPTTHAYLDYCQGDPTVDPPIYANLRVSKTYSFEPVPDGVDPKYILGGQGNLWTEQIPTLRHAQYMTYPRAWALAEVNWSPREKRDWSSFVNRMEYHFERNDVAGINYAKSVYDAIVTTSWENGKLMLNLEAEIPGLDMHYTLDGTMPDSYSPKYTKPVEIPEGPITLRVITHRNGKPIGHLITLKVDELKMRQ